jgi:hypothetical protein
MHEWNVLLFFAITVTWAFFLNVVGEVGHKDGGAL